MLILGKKRVWGACLPVHHSIATNEQVDFSKHHPFTPTCIGARAVSSTTRVGIDSQYERRNWIISVDDSPEQTELIRKLKAKNQRERNEIALGLREELCSKRSARILKGVMDKIEPCKVIIPFPDALLKIFEQEKLRVRGDYEKILRLVEYYCMLRQRTLPTLELENGKKAIFATPEAALEILEVAKEPLTLMTLELDARTRKLLETIGKMGVKSAGDAITPDKREDISVKLGYASNTLRIYLNEMVKKKYLTDNDMRPKTYRLAQSLSSIQRKASAITELLENADALRTEMTEEAWKSLRRLSAKTTIGGLDMILETYPKLQTTPPLDVCADSELGGTMPPLSETGSEHPQKQEMLTERGLNTPSEDTGRFQRQREFVKILSDIEKAIHPEPVDLNIFVTELVTNNGWKASDVKRVSDILKRDRVLFEPRPGFIKMNHGGN